MLGLGLEPVPGHGPWQAACCGSLFPTEAGMEDTAAARWFLRFLQTLYCRSDSMSTLTKIVEATYRNVLWLSDLTCLQLKPLGCEVKELSLA